MMIVAAWLVYCFLIAGMLTLGAAAWERSARWSGRPARWGWMAALVGSVMLPWLLRLVPERGWVDAVPAAASALRMDPLVMTGGAGSSSWSAAEVALVFWALASVLMLGYVALVFGRLVRARRRWRETELDGGPVLMSSSVGPAAVGVRRGVVVLPAWVMELDAELRSLLLRHERAHVEAGDPRLLLAGLVLLAAMPWNPVVWLQVLRLRNAIELDCDARVLSAGADPARYGSLLLEVGRRRSSHALVMATFAEPRAFLEQRIRRISQWPLERRRARAAMFATTALLLFVTALSCADPMRVQNANEVPRQAGERAGVVAPEAQPQSADPSAVSDKPVFTPMTVAPELQNRADVARALVRNYPPLLRDAGIGGNPTVHFFIDEEGIPQKTLIGKSSGYPALDAAALHVASTMRFSPALNRDRIVPVWVEIPIVFSIDGATRGSVKLPPPPEVSGDEAASASPVPAVKAPLGDISREPVFTPMTVAPELQNRAEVGRALVRHYPPLLRDAGIGGSPTVHFFIDEHGVVRNTMLSKSSGYPALDQAALRVANSMRFTAAKNRDRAVPVWVEIPIVFTAK